MLRSRNDLLKEITKLQERLARIEKELVKCCKENEHLRKEFTKKRIKEVKRRSNNPIYL